MGREIHRRLWLCNADLKGAYRYRDVFQLVPTEVRPPYDYGDRPVWIEVAVDDPPSETPHTHPKPDWIRYAEFADKRSAEIVALLNLLLKYRIFSNRGLQTWFIPHDNIGDITQPETTEKALWGQADYSDDKICEFGDVATFSEMQMLPTTQSNEYYSRQIHPVNGGPQCTISDVPDIINSCIYAYFKLNYETKEVFCGSLKLFNDSLDIFRYGISRSLQVVCLISSIETLAKLQHEKGGSAEKFRMFLKKYAYIFDEEFLNKAYKIRCDIVHDGSMLIRDLPEWGTIDDSDEYFLLWNLRDIARIAIINWLLQAHTDGGASKEA